ncbi:MAG: putative RNA uridine N3 methyltransferase [Sulfolobales archaeon]
MVEGSSQSFIWPPPARDIWLSIHVPASIVSVEHGIVKKTLVIGLVARASAIFRVNRIALYRDPGSSVSDLELVRKILEYVLAPPYLRKRLFGIDRDLRAVGVLPPLAIASHPTEEDIEVDHIRPAMVTNVMRNKVCLDPGLDGERCINIDSGIRPRVGEIIYIWVSRGGRVEGIAGVEEVKKIYWGYRVETYRSLRESIRASQGELYIVATKKGAHDIDVLLERLRSADIGVSLIFGSPEKDPDEIALEEGWDLEDIPHLKFNSAPLQGVRSIRTYEAIYITLAMINSIIYRVKQI